MGRCTLVGVWGRVTPLVWSDHDDRAGREAIRRTIRSAFTSSTRRLRDGSRRYVLSERTGPLAWQSTRFELWAIHLPEVYAASRGAATRRVYSGGRRTNTLLYPEGTSP